MFEDDWGIDSDNGTTATIPPRHCRQACSVSRGLSPHSQFNSQSDGAGNSMLHVQLANHAVRYCYLPPSLNRVQGVVLQQSRAALDPGTTNPIHNGYPYRSTLADLNTTSPYGVEGQIFWQWSTSLDDHCPRLHAQRLGVQAPRSPSMADGCPGGTSLRRRRRRRGRRRAQWRCPCSRPDRRYRASSITTDKAISRH